MLHVSRAALLVLLCFLPSAVPTRQTLLVEELSSNAGVQAPRSAVTEAPAVFRASSPQGFSSSLLERVRLRSTNACAHFLEEFWAFPRRWPFVTNVLLATVKTGVADVVVQLGTRGCRSEAAKEADAAGGAGAGVDSSPIVRHGIDWKRAAFFASFGFMYVGLIEWFFYVDVFIYLCPLAIGFANEPWYKKVHDGAGMADLSKQVFLDNFVHNVFIYFPIFYMLKAIVLLGGKQESITKKAEKGLQMYWDNIVWDNLKYMAIWIPGDYLVYAVPMWLRMPVNHGISFAWTMLLSCTRGS